MAASAPRYVTKTEICRLFAWSRYQFDLNVQAGMPVVEAADGRSGQWRVDPRAVKRWATRRAQEKAARERAWAQERERERRKFDEIVRRRAEVKERAEREARERREERWRREEERRRAERLLDACYSICKRCAYEDIGRPYGPSWSRDTPHWLTDWPTERPGWWAPPPGLPEAVAAEPSYKPFGHREPDWRRWVPKYVPGRPWPWREDPAAPAARDQAGRDPDRR